MEMRRCTASADAAASKVKSITYMVRPFMHPAKFERSLARISSGCFQLLVGPASSLFSEQIHLLGR